MTSPRTQTRRPSRGLRVLLRVVVGLALVTAGVVIVPQVQQNRRTSGLQSAVDEAYATRLSYSDLSARIEVASHGLDPDLLGVPFTEPAPPSGCGPVRGVGASWDHAPQVVVTRLQAGTFSTKATDRLSDCKIPLPVNDQKQTLIEASFTLEDVTADRPWVIVERRTEFFSYDLGCGLILCGPRSAEPASRPPDRRPCDADPIGARTPQVPRVYTSRVRALCSV